MMSTPFYSLVMLTSAAGWMARLENSAEWLKVAAWAVVKINEPGNQEYELILPCIATRDGCLEPTDMAEEIRTEQETE